jgi:hypothetical protein
VDKHSNLMPCWRDVLDARVRSHNIGMGPLLSRQAGGPVPTSNATCPVNRKRTRVTPSATLRNAICLVVLAPTKASTSAPSLNWSGG